MLNIRDILIHVHNGVKDKDARYVVEDDEHILDTLTSVEYHLYDDGGKVTHGDVVIAKMPYYTKAEQEVLTAIKKLISDPAVMQQKIAHYPVMVKEARIAFASLYETPEPIVNVGPVAEVGTTPYHG